ncbi:hypothetical protein SLS62_000892 [Diatrype stigma]|uniref:Uncharacterized protein n=1 Tax=Diatrype stigma TaxID=117547 RepID=A0AAN9YTW7_9PEZI
MDHPSTDCHGKTANGHHAANPYTIPDTILGYRRPIKIIVIGFGILAVLAISYAPAQETLGYLKSVVAHHKLDTSVKYSHRLVGAWWEQDQNRWKVKIQPNDDPAAAFFDYSDILVTATGALK